MPFGLSNAPFIFTKVVRPLVKYWRSSGIKIVVFIDDGAGSDTSFDLAVKNSNFVKRTLLSSGFLPNAEKSQWMPAQNLDWLGFHINTAENILSLTDKRVISIKNTISNILDSLPWSTPRKLAGIAGKIISTSFMTGNISSLMSRSIHRVIASATFDGKWDKKLNLSKQNSLIRELFFWKRNIQRLNYRFLKSFEPHRFVGHSDAGDLGVGAVLRELDNNYKRHICHQLFSAGTLPKSSTLRELKAILFAIESFKKLLSGARVKWYTDNQAACHIFKKGSMKPYLQDLALDLFTSCLSNHITVDVQWIPRTENQEADAISKMIDYDDWETTQVLFQYLNDIWGPHTIDRFADNKNAKVSRFNSRFWCPGTEGVDAF